MNVLRQFAKNFLKTISVLAGLSVCFLVVSVFVLVPFIIFGTLGAFLTSLLFSKNVAVYVALFVGFTATMAAVKTLEDTVGFGKVNELGKNFFDYCINLGNNNAT